MCFYLRNWQVTFLLYTLGVFISEYIAKASMEPRDYRVVFLIQQINIHPPSGWFFSFGYNPNTTGHAQVRLLLACQPRIGLFATRKRVPWIK